MTNPTIAPDGTQVYFENNKRHRIGGPAVIGKNGAQAYWENNK
jgi:hypothetical protein